MRLGVLDIGSNTGHLLVVDAAGGAAPLPAYSFKEPLRLAEHLDDDGAMTKKGITALTDFVGSALEVAESKGCEEMYAFATSATRDSANSDEVLDAVKDETGVELEVLPGDDEARLTFLAVRRWFGWSSGRLLVFDIGGGSLEIATGQDENPDVVQSLPLGAGRLTRDLLTEDPPDPKAVKKLRKSIRADLAREAGSGAARRRPAARRGDVEDVPVAGPHVRRRTLRGGDVRPAHARGGGAAREDGRAAGHGRRAAQASCPGSPRGGRGSWWPEPSSPTR